METMLLDLLKALGPVGGLIWVVWYVLSKAQPQLTAQLEVQRAAHAAQLDGQRDAMIALLREERTECGERHREILAEIRALRTSRRGDTERRGDTARLRRPGTESAP